MTRTLIVPGLDGSPAPHWQHGWAATDPWMRHSRATSLARSWGAELVDVGLAGHINVASGFGPWWGGKWLRDALLGDSAMPQRLAAQRQEARA